MIYLSYSNTNYILFKRHLRAETNSKKAFSTYKDGKMFCMILCPSISQTHKKFQSWVITLL